MEIRPEFYDNFTCLAERCQHSCCRGWEIDVDEETARRYLELEGTLGDELRGNLTRADGTWSFRLTATEDCPFLRSDGLCRLILELGEDALCDICALHPRFYEDVGEHELSGVSMSCEAAAALLLSGRGELTFLTERDEPLTLRELLRSLGWEIPAEALRFSPTIDDTYYRAILRRYARCEAIDEAWSRELAALADADDLTEQARVYIKQYDQTAYQRAFDYILYRQIERMEGCGTECVCRFAREAADFIFLRDAGVRDTVDCLRRWSAEMEYSTENIDIIMGEYRA